MINHQNFGVMGNSFNMDPYQNGMQMNQQMGQMQNTNGLQNYARTTTPVPPPIIRLPARMVNSLEEIRPNEAPSDGTVALFLQNDCSCIYAKAVNGQGMIDTVRYVPEKIEEPIQETKPDNSLTELFAKMESRLDKVDERFDKFEQLLAKKTYYKPHYNKQNQKEDKK